MKNETKHTPGPWAMHPIYNGNKGTLYGWGINGVNDTGTMFTSGRIVDVPCNAPNHDWPTQEANARLIAAAPDLLAALQDEKAALETWRAILQLPPDLEEGFNISLDKITRAIAKAEEGEI